MRLATSNFHSAVSAWPLLVDGERDERGPVLLREDRLRVERLAAVFEVDAVDDRLAAAQLQRRLDHRHFGAVEHDRLGEHLVVALDDLLHVADAVAADVVHAHVEDVNALALLLLGHLDEAVPVLLFEQLLELPRAVGVGPLADQQRPLIDQQFLRRSAGSTPPGCTSACAARASCRCTRSHDRLRGGPCVVPQQPPTMFTPNSVTNRSSQSASGSGVEREVRLVAAVLRQAGVRQHAQQLAGSAGSGGGCRRASGPGRRRSSCPITSISSSGSSAIERRRDVRAGEHLLAARR